jgi:hypothetical protein
MNLLTVQSLTGALYSWDENALGFFIIYYIHVCERLLKIVSSTPTGRIFYKSYREQKKGILEPFNP